jgi:hypothetical protein
LTRVLVALMLERKSLGQGLRVSERSDGSLIPCPPWSRHRISLSRAREPSAPAYPAVPGLLVHAIANACCASPSIQVADPRHPPPPLCCGPRAPAALGAGAFLVRVLFALYGFTEPVPPAGELSGSDRATRCPTEELRDGLWCHHRLEAGRVGPRLMAVSYVLASMGSKRPAAR